MVEKLKTMEELEAIMDDFDEQDLIRFRPLAPEGTNDERLKLIAACTDDDLDDDEWKKLFADCQDKSLEEVQLLAKAASLPEE